MTLPRHALITGFPGFIARRLVRKLLCSDDTLRITALIEPSQQVHAERAKQALTETTGDPSVAARLQTVIGDVTAIDVGLSGAEFRELSRSVTEIHHLAAAHALAAERRHAERVNVHGTSNMLAFARAAPDLERFVHFSSAYVSGNRTGVIMEDELDAGQAFRNAYERTKHQAEQLVRQASPDLPVTIIRPAGVVGDSRTGEIDRFDSVYHLGMLMIASPASVPVPLSGDGHAPLNLVPVDYLVDVVHAVCAREATLGQTFHVVDPNPLSARRIYEVVGARAGRKLPRYQVPANLTKALLRIPGLERLAPVSHQAIDYLNHMAFYNSRNTSAVIEGTGITCPHFEDYVDTLIKYVRDYFERASA